MCGFMTHLGVLKTFHFLKTFKKILRSLKGTMHSFSNWPLYQKGRLKLIVCWDIQLIEAYKLAIITQAVGFLGGVPFIGRSLKETSPEHVYEAQLARLLLRCKLLLQDAVMLTEKVAKPFYKEHQKLPMFE